MIIVCHIEKTGGTSFRRYLEATFGPRLYADYGLTRASGPTWWRQLVRRVRRQWLKWPAKIQVPAGTQCIIGHFTAGRYGRSMPSAQLAIWLRDPVERLVSHYYHFRRDPDPRNPLYRALAGKDVSLHDFATFPEVRNLQASRVGRWPLRQFAFVGLTEQYAASVQLFARTFGCAEPAAIARVNQNPNRQSDRYPLDAALREHIRQQNLLDEELYLAGRQRFHELCKTHGVTVSPPALAS
jgi:hypothetical protein